MKTLLPDNRGKLLGLSVILIFSAAAYLMKRYKNPDCDPQKISFHGIDMKFPQSVSDAKRDYNLSYEPYHVMARVFDDIPKRTDGYVQFVKVMFPMSERERYWKPPPESSILSRQVNGYSFNLSLDGDSLRRKLETDFGSKFELKDNKRAIKAGVKWTTCYEMKINECLYIATSNFGRGKVVTWITFMYGLDEAEREEFYH